MRTKKISGIVLFLLIFTHISFCQTDWFTGHVYDTITGESIPGAVIYVGNEGWPPHGDVYSDTSNSSGYYSIEVPIADDYTVLAIAPGFISKSFIMQEPYEAIEFPLQPMPFDFLVKTINMGLVHYDYNGIFCYREDGLVEQSEHFFPDIDQQSDTIDMFLDEIGAGSFPTFDDSLLYAKLNIIWVWFRDNTWFAPSDPDWIIANAYMMEESWPSIHRIASTYYKFGVIPWGSCTSKGQITTTLLYRSGFPKNRVLMVEALNIIQSLLSSITDGCTSTPSITQLTSHPMKNSVHTPFLYRQLYSIWIGATHIPGGQFQGLLCKGRR
ncbi:carboxypeptidase-like regulatory domain-containing protein [bacterium]|nr:carboxypeptidase-like regulatory domain-containing protein [bacterium]